MKKYKNRVIIVALLAIAMFVIGGKNVYAFNYAGYRWGGWWPVVTVDSSGVAVVAWKNVITGSMNNWNDAGARFTFQNGSSNNKISVYWESSNTLAVSRIYRQWWGGGNVSKVTVGINNYYSFYPGSSSGYDLATVMRHEFGHWLVLNHTNPPSLMQPNLGAREVQYVGTDDKNGIKYIYGAR
jgi:hypothetical protein